MLRLILASGSPRRRDLLSKAGYDFDVLPPDAEEISDDCLSPADLTETNAGLKAAAVAASHPQAVVIGADTLVFLDGGALGKPATLSEAQAMLEGLVGRAHQVCTGVAILCGAKTLRFHVSTEVTFKPLSPSEIRSYLALIDPLDKAGAYAAQEHGERIIESTRGSFTNVIGLPMEELAEHLRNRFGIEPGGVPAEN